MDHLTLGRLTTIWIPDESGIRIPTVYLKVKYWHFNPAGFAKLTFLTFVTTNLRKTLSQSLILHVKIIFAIQFLKFNIHLYLIFFKSFCLRRFFLFVLTFSFMWPRPVNHLKDRPPTHSSNFKSSNFFVVLHFSIFNRMKLNYR